MVKLKEKFLLSRAKAHDLSGVKTLNFWGGNIDDISILECVPNAEVINASANIIENLQSFSYCVKLRELYLRKNKIKDIKELYNLKGLKNLKYLWLSGNPFCDKLSVEEYRSSVLKVLPHLKKLDNETVTAEELTAVLRNNFSISSVQNKSWNNEEEEEIELSKDEAVEKEIQLLEKEKTELISDEVNNLDISEKKIEIDENENENESPEVIVSENKISEIDDKKLEIDSINLKKSFESEIDETIEDVDEAVDTKTIIFQPQKSELLTIKSVTKEVDTDEISKEEKLLLSDEHQTPQETNEDSKDQNNLEESPEEESIKDFPNDQADDLNSSPKNQTITPEELNPADSVSLDEQVKDVDEVEDEDASDSELTSCDTLQQLNKIRIKLGSEPLTPEKYLSSTRNQQIRKKPEKQKNNNLLTATLALIEELDTDSLYLVRDKIDEKLEESYYNTPSSSPMCVNLDPTISSQESGDGINPILFAA